MLLASLKERDNRKEHKVARRWRWSFLVFRERSRPWWLPVCFSLRL